MTRLEAINETITLRCISLGLGAVHAFAAIHAAQDELRKGHSAAWAVSKGNERAERIAKRLENLRLPRC